MSQLFADDPPPTIDLVPFCASPDDPEPSLSASMFDLTTPFVVGGREYASNGHYLLWCDYTEKADTPTLTRKLPPHATVDADRIRTALSSGFVEAVPFPAFRRRVRQCAQTRKAFGVCVGRSLPCSCKGLGVHRCETCGHVTTCSECGGTGRVYRPCGGPGCKRQLVPYLVKYGEYWFRADYYLTMSRLPDARILVPRAGHIPALPYRLAFQFRGGQGVLAAYDDPDPDFHNYEGELLDLNQPREAEA